MIPRSQGVYEIIVSGSRNRAKGTIDVYLHDGRLCCSREDVPNPDVPRNEYHVPERKTNIEFVRKIDELSGEE